MVNKNERNRKTEFCVIIEFTNSRDEVYVILIIFMYLFNGGSRDLEWVGGCQVKILG